MFSDHLKSILVFNRNQHKAPNVVLVYLVIWLLWHQQFFVTLMLSQGSFTARFQQAIDTNHHQYIVVLGLTTLFFALRLLYLFVTDKTNRFIDDDKPIEEKLGSDQLFTENKDAARLVELFEQTKAELAAVKTREKQAKAEKTQAINEMLAKQHELDLALADIEILSKSNQELTAKLRDVNLV